MEIVIHEMFILLPADCRLRLITADCQLSRKQNSVPVGNNTLSFIPRRNKLQIYQVALKKRRISARRMVTRSIVVPVKVLMLDLRDITYNQERLDIKRLV